MVEKICFIAYCYSIERRGKMAFSSKLQKLRGDSGLSQEQLAIELNVSRHGTVIIGLN